MGIPNTLRPFDANNPFMPPLPPPSSAGAGFQIWASEPENAMKVQPSMTSPSAPLQPNAGMSAANPPGVQPSPLTPPGVTPQTVQPSSVAPAAPTPQAVQPSPLTPAIPTQEQDMAANPGEYQRPTVRGTGTAIANMLVAGLAGAAGGLNNRDPMAGVRYALGTQQHDENVPVANQETYQTRILKPQQQALQTQKLKGDIAHTAAETEALQNKPDTKTTDKQIHAYVGADGKQHVIMMRPDNTTYDQPYGDVNQKDGKEPSRDDKAIKIMQDEFKAKNPKLTDDQTYKMAFDKWVTQTKTQPGVAKMEVLVNSKPVQVVDPNNPDNIVYDRTGHAIASGAAAPGSVGFQVNKKTQEQFTSGDVGKQLMAINTAREHVKSVLAPLASALDNGDVQSLNRLGNQLGVQFGDDKVTNYRIAAAAVGSEAAKAFDGSGFTQSEREDAKQRISDYMSRGQIGGAVKTIDALLAGKQKVAKDTYNINKGGQPNFGDNPLKPPTSQAGPKVGDVEGGHRFKGGNPADPNSWELVKKGGK